MAVNIVPERLNDFRVYYDGKTDLLGIANIQLPSFASMVETVSGAGIAGEYESPLLGHFQSMKLTFSWRTLNRNQLLLTKQQAMRFDCRGAFQQYDPAKGKIQISTARIVVHGPATNNEMGSFEKNAASDGSTEVEVLYIKVDIDNKNVIELDKLNYKCVIDGVDYLADVRRALGL